MNAAAESQGVQALIRQVRLRPALETMRWLLIDCSSPASHMLESLGGSYMHQRSFLIGACSSQALQYKWKQFCTSFPPFSLHTTLVPSIDLITTAVIILAGQDNAQ